MGSHRLAQVNELVHHTVSEILLRDVEMPLGVFVTISSVDTSKDLKYAKIFLTVLPNNRRRAAFEELRRHFSHIQKIFGRKIRLRITPLLSFVLDEGQVHAQDLFDKMDHVDPL